MTREEAIKWIERIKEKYIHGGDEGFDDARRRALDMAIEALQREIPRNPVINHVSDDVQGWIPVKWHEITDEEREREGYPKDWTVYIDCKMPYDGQEILTQTKNGYIRWDVCYEDGEFSLDSGWDWVEDILAWMPLPMPYREDSEE